MKINLEQLTNHLKKSPASIYIVSGDETLLVEEACELIRQTARQYDFSERELFQIESGFNWGHLSEIINNYSLFSTKSLVELRIPNNKITDAGKKMLKDYGENPLPDKILLLVMNKLDKRALNTAWFKNIEKNSVHIPIWPIPPQQLPMWIKTRLQALGLHADSSAIRFIAENVEGNLLAAKQEIEKLNLLFDKKNLTLDDIVSAMSNNSRYTIFDLVDCALSGNAKRTQRIFKTLKEEGIDPTLILWGLARETRGLLLMKEKLKTNSSIESILRSQFVFEKRKPLIRAALNRLNIQKLQKILKKSSQTDRMIKGISTGNVWDQLEQISISLF